MSPKEGRIDVKEILKEIQIYVFQRRLRVKEAFADFDPHRHHLITKSQFIRVIDTSLQSYLQPHQADALAEYYDANGNGMIHYISFCDDIDEVFCPTKGLEAISPTLEVPQPGYGINTAFIPRDIGQRFTDFDRHNTGSITATQFFRKFPLYEALTPHEKDILQQRYGYEGNGCEMMNYKSLLQDIEDITNPTATTTKEESSPPHKTGEDQHTVWGDKWYNTSLPLIQLLQAKVVERRLRLREYFKDFDPLKKGTCKRAHVLCVLTLLKLHLSPQELDGLLNEYSTTTAYDDNGDTFHYLQLCEEVDAVFADKRVCEDLNLQTSMPGPQDTNPARRNARQLTQEEITHIKRIEEHVAARVQRLRILLKPQFLNFDKCGRQTVTVSQFKRVFATLGFDQDLTEQEMDLLARKYTNMGNTLEVNYRDFCSTVDPSPPLCVDNSLAKNILPSNYHDRTGQVIRQQ
ncbi:hypothetical protein FOZ61_009047 [Perkinsus olseni]|uniref:Uncharacterized protein n=2 Tax=Perkinsus olseni TaxID=32597 RepID=A0A7J6M644_PEROL|nr:hypothetical protein FOZ61_009047 [Perkinsus olseni]